MKRSLKQIVEDEKRIRIIIHVKTTVPFERLVTFERIVSHDAVSLKFNEISLIGTVLNGKRDDIGRYASHNWCMTESVRKKKKVTVGIDDVGVVDDRAGVFEGLDDFDDDGGTSQAAEGVFVANDHDSVRTVEFTISASEYYDGFVSGRAIVRFLDIVQDVHRPDDAYVGWNDEEKIDLLKLCLYFGMNTFENRDPRFVVESLERSTYHGNDSTFAFYYEHRKKALIN